jgi:ribose 5-phosphate isomerase A
MKQMDKYKKMAAEKAVDFIQDGMIVGLGSGSTAAFAIQKIAQLHTEGLLKKIKGIPSSKDTEKLARRLNFPLTNFGKIAGIDVTIDGADEVDNQLNLIKGGGGALLREKILIQASERIIIIVDESKRTKKLGTNWPLPIEVLPFGWENEANYLEQLKANITLRRRSDNKIYLTDQRNYILDAHFGVIQNPEALDQY